MTLTATVYTLPNGAKSTITVTKINPDDAAWFKAHEVDISMEQLRDGEFAIYGGLDEDEDGEPIEMIELAKGRSAEETFAALRKQCQDYLDKP